MNTEQAVELYEYVTGNQLRSEDDGGWFAEEAGVLTLIMDCQLRQRRYSFHVFPDGDFRARISEDGSDITSAGEPKE